MSSEYIRKCDNCFWCMDEESVKNLNNLNGKDLFKVGDCSRGMEHDENYYCSCYYYADGVVKTSVTYDEVVMGPGYAIVGKIDDKMFGFIKFIREEDSFKIISYDAEWNLRNTNRVDIELNVSLDESEELFNIINKLRISIGNNVASLLGFGEMMITLMDTKTLELTIAQSKNFESKNGIMEVIINSQHRGYYALEEFYSNLKGLCGENVCKLELKKI